jgi:hypothetical protein
MLPRSVVVLAVLSVLALPASAMAAVHPKPKAILVAHLHGTRGHDYHVEVDVDKTGTKLTIAVLYLQECHETTAAKQNIPIQPDGTFGFTADLPDGAGTWGIKGTFDKPDHVVGQASMTRSDCAVTDKLVGLGINTGHVILGNPYDYPPKAINGNSFDARHLRGLHNRSLAAAKKFATPQIAARKGYRITQTKLGCPGLHHARKHGTTFWGKLLDPNAPQSLVYWCDSKNKWKLAAFMFRAPEGVTPNTYNGLLQWHKHSLTAAWMTHVWMVPSVTGSFATCAPFSVFERFSVLTYEPFYVDTMPDKPCGDTPGLVETNNPTN